MDMELALLIAKFAVTHGIDAVTKITTAIGKETITVDDWNDQAAAWEKSPDDFLAEAEARK
jgi:hypothetical protein